MAEKQLSGQWTRARFLKILFATLLALATASIDEIDSTLDSQ